MMPMGGMDHCCVCSGRRELGDERPCGPGCGGMICGPHMAAWPWEDVSVTHDPSVPAIEGGCVVCGGPMPPRTRKAGRPPKTCSDECRRRRTSEQIAASKRRQRQRDKARDDMPE